MMNASTSAMLAVAAAVFALLALGGFWWFRSRRRSPAERERIRRLAVSATGRFTDGVLIEAPYALDSPPAPDLLFYRYRASGVEYTAAQDVSALLDFISPASCRPGTPATVKYNSRRPSNSILVCELWSGLPERRSEPSDPVPAGAPGRGLLSREL